MFIIYRYDYSIRLHTKLQEGFSGRFSLGCSKQTNYFRNIESKNRYGRQYDKTDLFKTFTLQYGLTTYTTTNGTPVWSASGTWKFKDDTATVITRDDEIEITIESISDTEFIYSLTWTKTTYAGGKAKSVNGLHKFDMVR